MKEAAFAREGDLLVNDRGFGVLVPANLGEVCEDGRDYHRDQRREEVHDGHALEGHGADDDERNEKRQDCGDGQPETADQDHAKEHVPIELQYPLTELRALQIEHIVAQEGAHQREEAEADLETPHHRGVAAGELDHIRRDERHADG